MIDSTTGLPTSIRQSSEDGERAGRVRGRLVAVASLTPAQRSAMFVLFAHYFTSDRATFDRDLSEKESVVLLTDEETGAIAGFSTLMRFDVMQQSRPITIFFSGDTIVERRYWGSPVLPRTWSQHVFRCAASLPHDAYWFLISSGFRTYRYLPLFFRRFSPSPDAVDAAERSLLDDIALARFGTQYDPMSGVVRLRDRTPLRHATGDEGRRATVDRYVRYFLDANPGHAEGDELACLVRISRDNLTPAGRRMLRHD